MAERLFYHLRLQMNFERVKSIIFGSFNAIRYDLQFGSVEQMLTAHLADLDIPICCGFPIAKVQKKSAPSPSKYRSTFS